MNNLLEDLNNIGMDTPGALERFMNNEELYVRFLKKFLADPNMEALKESIAGQDYENAFKQAHTLKGVTGNLGLTTLYLPLSELVECLRNNSIETVDAQLESIHKEYIRACHMIENF